MWTEELLRQSADRLVFRCTTYGTNRSPYKWVCVFVCVCARTQVFFFICCTDGDSTSRILGPLTSRNLTQHCVLTGKWRLVLSVYVNIVRHMPDDDDDDDNLVLLLLFLSLSPVFMCVLIEQPSGQLLKQHKCKEITPKKREENRKSNAASAVKHHS